MGYIVNVDRPTGKATIHTDDVGNRANCRPHEKLPEDGYWTDSLDTEDAAMQAASREGLRVHWCRNCFP